MKWAAYAVLAMLLAPLALTIPISLTSSTYLALPRGSGDLTLRWYRELAANPVWLEAAVNSLIVAALTALGAAAVALAAALAMTHAHFRGRRACEAALLLPMALPGVALAAGMLAVVRLTPLWGSHLSLALAHATIAMPVAYLVLRASLSQQNRDLESAARGLGAGPWQVLRFVTLPLALPAVLAAALFAFVISLNEVTLSLFLATRDTQTLPRVIWPHLRFAVSPAVAAASVVLLLVTLPALAAAGWFAMVKGGSWSRSTT